MKYTRRWVEVTPDTLAYSTSPSEIAAGNIQVFSMRDLAWVRKEGTSKFTVSRVWGICAWHGCASRSMRAAWQSSTM